MKSIREYLFEGSSVEFARKVETAPAGRSIFQASMAVCEFLLDKNAAYGNSALEPINAFSKAPAGEQIRTRIDDKINRLVKGEAVGEDVEEDLLGYLLLLLVHDHHASLQDPRRETRDRGLRDRGPERNGGPEQVEQASPTLPDAPGVSGERAGDGGGNLEDPPVSRMEARLRAEHVRKMSNVPLPRPGLCQGCNIPVKGGAVVCDACIQAKGFHRFEGPPVERSSELVERRSRGS